LNSLYITYDGLLDPLGQSQVLPYVESLISAGHSFTLVSYEKESRSDEEILTMKKKLNVAQIEWVPLLFVTGKFATVKKIITGIITLWKIKLNVKPDVVHLRGFMSVLIYRISLCSTPYIYDFRSFTVGEWMELGKLREHSLFYNLLKIIDQKAVQSASAVVVLEKSAELLLRQRYNVPDVPLKVIRTCTDLSLYQPLKDSRITSPGELMRFVCLGGARPPVYRPDLAIMFVSLLLKHDVDCHLDFINERDHDDIFIAAEKVSFPIEKLSVRSLDHQLIAQELYNYDCGLIFIQPTVLRRVCSPTKLGEYLAAGLPVVALKGIAVLDDLSINSTCVAVVDHDQLSGAMGVEEVHNLIHFIKRPGVDLACQALAAQEFSLDMAGRLYTELYAEIENNLS